MVEIIETCQEWLMWAGLVALAALGLGWLGWTIVIPFWERLRRFASLSVLQQVLLGVFIVGMVQYGATKSKISFDGGIKDSTEQKSVVTNDTVSIFWERDTSGGIVVPVTASVYIDYRQNSVTNAPWINLAETFVGKWGWTGSVANATNYDYNVWAYYIPPEPVHTNGVWIYKALKDRAEKHPIPLRARIEVNGKAIATPAEVRKDGEAEKEDAL